MFPPTDNPAQRLLEILERARTAENHPISKVWGGVFGIADMDAPTCYRVLGHLNGLVDSVEARIRQLPDLNHALYLQDLPTIRAIICVPNIQSHWHQIKGPLDQGVLTGLRFCANELSKHHKEDAIAPEELEKIRKDFTAIFRTVSKAEITPDLKLVLFDILTSAILAIEQYKILGNDGLKKAVAYTIGMLTLHKDEFLTAKKDGIITQTLTAIKGLCNLITIAYRIKALGSAFSDILHLPDTDGK